MSENIEKNKLNNKTVVGTIGEITSYITFIFTGLFGIYIGLFSILHLKDPNYMILIGGIGIAIVILMYAVDKKGSKKEI